MTQGFDEWLSIYQPSLDTSAIEAEFIFEAGAASRQGEVDELRNEIDLLKKEIIETQEFLNRQNHIKQNEIDELRKQINSIKGIMSGDVYHIPTLIKDLNNEIKGEGSG